MRRLQTGYTPAIGYSAATVDGELNVSREIHGGAWARDGGDNSFALAMGLVRAPLLGGWLGLGARINYGRRVGDTADGSLGVVYMPSASRWVTWQVMLGPELRSIRGEDHDIIESYTTVAYEGMLLFRIPLGRPGPKVGIGVRANGFTQIENGRLVFLVGLGSM